MMMNSPMVDVVNGAGNMTKDTEHLVENGTESRDSGLLSFYQGRFSLFKDGILRLKQFYDMQMLLMKSYLHGHDGDTMEMFFSKLVQIMELAVKQIFTLMDLSKLEGRNDELSCDQFNKNAMSFDQNLSSKTQEASNSQQCFDEIPSTSILSPQFDLSYTNNDDVTSQTNDVTSQTNDIIPKDRTYEEPPDLSSPGPSNLGTSSIDSANQYATEAGFEVANDDTCDFCNLTFTTKRDLIRHTRTHTGEKPYHCDICMKYFARKDFLTKHKRTHTGEKPHSCPECNKRFSQRSNLNKHVVTHTKNHKYCCKICGRGFHQMINLHRHEQVHCNTSKQFQCLWCKKMSYQGSDCLKTLLDKQEVNNEIQ